jgi:hypothetical protein
LITTKEGTDPQAPQMPIVSEYTRGRLDAIREIEAALFAAVRYEQYEGFEGPSQRPLIELFRVDQILKEARAR